MTSRGQRTRIANCLAGVIVALVSVVSPAQTSITAFVDVTVIPMTEAATMARQTVLVEGGRITRVGGVRDVRVPEGATIIDGRGKFLIPGLGDAHAHLSSPGGGVALAERAMPLYALNGVTMVRSMYTEPHHKAVRDRVERGELLGPQSMLVSPGLTGQNVRTPDAARDSVRKFHADGYTYVKVLGGMNRAVFDTLAAEARRLGLQFGGHVPAGTALRDVLNAAYTSIEHLDGFFESMIRRDAGLTAAATGFFGLGLTSALDETLMPELVAATKKAGTVVVPTEFEMELFVSLDSGAALARRPEMRYVPRALLDNWTLGKDNFARNAGVTTERVPMYRNTRRRLILALHNAGVPIAVGSDAFNQFDVAGFGVFNEMETLVDAGMTPFAALRSATVEVAALLKMERVTGTVVAGSVADLVLLDGNPLASIGNVRRQSGVMLRGRWLPKEEIQRRLDSLAVR